MALEKKFKAQIKIRLEDRSTVTVAYHDDGIVVMKQAIWENSIDNANFAEYPELRAVWDDGWVLDELKSLVEKFEFSEWV